MVADDVSVRRLIYLERYEIQTLRSRNFRFDGITTIAARGRVQTGYARFCVDEILFRKAIARIGTPAQSRICRALVSPNKRRQVRANHMVGTGEDRSCSTLTLRGLRRGSTGPMPARQR